jgi:hypothetical protein
MNLRSTLPLLLALALSPVAFAQDPAAGAPVDTAKADAQAERIGSDTAKYLAELDASIKLAREGQYGKLPRGSHDRLAALRANIGELLRDGVDPRTLEPGQRLALFNAHQELESILKKDDKSRVVCTRDADTGTRIATTKCMTVGEREERARVAQRGTESFQRNVCTPGPGNSCTQ